MKIWQVLVSGLTSGYISAYVTRMYSNKKYKEPDVFRETDVYKGSEEYERLNKAFWDAAKRNDIKTMNEISNILDPPGSRYDLRVKPLTEK
jgi:hypothetical protein